MPYLFQQVFALLTSSTGSLTYHLVLAFAILASLQASALSLQFKWQTTIRRTLLGLGMMLFLRLALFLVVGAAWQGLLDADVFLPPLDRALMALSLVIIIWLWTFPEPNRVADTAFGLVGLLLLVVSALGVVWWSSQPLSVTYNGSITDQVTDIGAMVLILIGCLILLIRRPAGWGTGFFMLLLLFLGHIINLLFPIYKANFSGIVRLAQMAAYPLLFFLPQRFGGAEPPSLPVVEKALPEPVPTFEIPSTIDPRLLQSFLSLASETVPEETYHALTATLSRLLVADICLVALPADTDGKMVFPCGYDLVHEEHLLPEFSVIADSVPALVSVFQSNRPERFPADSGAPEQDVIANALELKRTGDLLAVPVVSSTGEHLCLLILMAPYSQRFWTPDEQNYLAALSRPLAQFLQHNQRLENLKRDLLRVSHDLDLAQERAQEAQTEEQNLLDQITSLRKNLDLDHQQIESLTLMVAHNQETEDSIAILQSENERLRQLVDQSAARLPGEASENQQELLLALEEIASLRQDLAKYQANEWALKSPEDETYPSSDQQAKFADMTGDLRQAMSSIIDYTDLLLDESSGALGALQRKFLERLKSSAERASEVADSLSLILVTDTKPSPSDEDDGGDEA